MSLERLLDDVRKIATGFAADGDARRAREFLDPADFAALAEAGWLRIGVPEAQGGLWPGLQAGIEPFAQLVLELASGDPAVALVATMHPLVLGYLGGDLDDDASAVRARIRAGVLAGDWWGTATSEPGSGGDVMRTRAIARPADDGSYRLTGEKHFASGSGICRFMVTTARVPGADAPERFFIDFAGSAWDGSDGIRLARAWDGMGMAATQSHAFRFEDVRAERLPGDDESAARAVVCLGGIGFTAVAVAIVRLAMDWARARLGPRHADLRAFEAVGLVDCENEAWLIEQAFAGTVRAVRARGIDAVPDVLRCKATVAVLAENLLPRLARVVGGASFSRGQALARWNEDIRALGFLRPPWGLAWDQLHAVGRPRATGPAGGAAAAE